MSLEHKEFPILEFDPARKAVIEPSEQITADSFPEHCVLCFFNEVVSDIRAETDAKNIFEDKWEDGLQQIFQLTHRDQLVAFCMCPVGAPKAAAILEEVIALGATKVIACGGAGVLDRAVKVGDIIIPTAAVRDEGTSYHYLPPSREIAADPDVIVAVESILIEHHIPFQKAKTWTTDGVFRETPDKVSLRKSEGCLTVEMEAAALFAVARFRNVKLGYMLYGGDDVSGYNWDRRSDWTRHAVRQKMFWLAVDACLRIQ